MLSKLSNTKTRNIFAVGAVIVVIIMVIPVGAVAASLTFKGIEGTSGNKADVTGASQLLTATANPANFYDGGDVETTTSGEYNELASPPTGDALVITGIQIDVYSDPSPGPDAFVALGVQTGVCSETRVGSYAHAVNPGSVGPIELTFDPGIAVPSGDSLCQVTDGSVESENAAIGYTVPASDVPAESMHRLAAPRQQERK
jgi:hypothetical protein